MNEEKRHPLFNLALVLTDTSDLVNPALVNHHKQVAYTSIAIAEEMGIDNQQKKSIALAAILHDIGAFSLRERMDLQQFIPDNPHPHALMGFKLLSNNEKLSDAAQIIRFHHIPWDRGNGAEVDGEPIPIGSHIIHLADRIVVSINRSRNILGQIKQIHEKIQGYSGKIFKPDLVEAFLDISVREVYWLDLVSPSLASILLEKVDNIFIDDRSLTSVAQLFSRIIDFRSRFQAIHSDGVTAVAETLAKLAGFDERECWMMKIAGCFHDLGKLAIPDEVLDKLETLSKDDFDYMRCHSFYTYRGLEGIESLGKIVPWAGFHHERINGNGYPFHLRASDLSTGSRIMAVADVVTAAMEDRPYRPGMSAVKIQQIVKLMAENSELDGDIVSLLISNFDVVNSARMKAQQAAEAERQKLFDN